MKCPKCGISIVLVLLLLAGCTLTGISQDEAEDIVDNFAYGILAQKGEKYSVYNSFSEGNYWVVQVSAREPANFYVNKQTGQIECASEIDGSYKDCNF